MIKGYARVSTEEQNLQPQVTALLAAGCGDIWTDRISGASSVNDRPALSQLMISLAAGDTLMVWKLDRLMRDLSKLLLLVTALPAGVQLVSLTEEIDTRTAAGTLMFHLAGTLAQHERDQIRERVRAGLDASRARGVKPGRRASLSPEQVELARELHAGGRRTRYIGAVLGVSHTTVLAAVKGDPPYGETVS